MGEITACLNDNRNSPVEKGNLPMWDGEIPL